MYLGIFIGSEPGISAPGGQKHFEVGDEALAWEMFEALEKMLKVIENRAVAVEVLEAVERQTEK